MENTITAAVSERCSPWWDVGSGLLVLLLLFIIIFPNFLLYIVFFLEIESKVHSTLSEFALKK